MIARSPSARAVLRLNAWTTIAAAIGMGLGARPLSATLGFETAGPILWLAGTALLAGVAALVTSVRRGLRRPSVLAFAFADLAIVGVGLGTLMIAPRDMSAVGQAAVATGMSILTWLALAELRAARTL